MYIIDTIGELPGVAKPPAAAAPRTVVAPLSGVAIAGVALVGVLLGALGLYAFERMRR